MSINHVLDDIQPPLQDHEREIVAKSRERGNPEWATTGLVTFGRVINKAILKRVATFLAKKEKDKMFGKSKIRTSVTDDGKATVFTLPDGVQVIVPDEVAANENFDPNPSSPTACYVWLSSVVVRSRIWE